MFQIISTILGFKKEDEDLEKEIRLLKEKNETLVQLLIKKAPNSNLSNSEYHFPVTDYTPTVEKNLKIGDKVIDIKKLEVTEITEVKNTNNFFNLLCPQSKSTLTLSDNDLVIDLSNNVYRVNLVMDIWGCTARLIFPKHPYKTSILISDMKGFSILRLNYRNSSEQPVEKTIENQEGNKFTDLKTFADLVVGDKIKLKTSDKFQKITKIDNNKTNKIIWLENGHFISALHKTSLQVIVESKSKTDYITILGKELIPNMVIFHNGVLQRVINTTLYEYAYPVKYTVFTEDFSRNKNKICVLENEECLIAKQQRLSKSTSL